MRGLPRLCLFAILLFTGFNSSAQPFSSRGVQVRVVAEKQLPLPLATVRLLAKDSSILFTTTSDNLGIAEFRNLGNREYICHITLAEYQARHVAITDQHLDSNTPISIQLEPVGTHLSGVTVNARKPFVQFLPDKTVVNVESSINSDGATVMEVLERSPGVTVDREGNISLKGRPSVQLMIDGKLTQLAGADLQNLLQGMSASQVETIELIQHPSARYDAAGNSGIINIVTKKSRQRGFNGSISTAYGQGRYPRTINSVGLNLREGDLHVFANFNYNANRNFYSLDALRTYYKTDGSVATQLKQSAFNKARSAMKNIKTGIDLSLNKKTTVGLVFNGTMLDRNNIGESPATWQNEMGVVDSVIRTTNTGSMHFNQRGVNFNARHVFDDMHELTGDIDFIEYRINNAQYFENLLLAPAALPEASDGSIPTDISIFTARIDFTRRFRNIRWEAGLKTSQVSTDNRASYYTLTSNIWNEDLGKSNHFLYKENIHAAYSSIDFTAKHWKLQAGLRYEYTEYDANQLGNLVNKDSSFSRNYHSLFPTVFTSWDADSSNSFTFRANRRIDRPVFQKLNPFLFIINKYTFQQGNPYFVPQFTWNFEIGHVFRQVFSTAFNYSITRDYFSQLFLSDITTGIVIYTDGNVGRMQQVGVTINAQLAPALWWSLSAEGTYNYKKITGIVENREFNAIINHFYFTMNNHFKFGKGWGAELSGQYITRSQNDLREILDPTGQLTAGISKQVLKNKGTVRLNVRDLFYTQIMQGLTTFPRLDEFFTLRRDTRVATISFAYRFGKAVRSGRRAGNTADDEMNRVGTGN